MHTFFGFNTKFELNPLRINKNGKNRFNFFGLLLFEPRIEDLKKIYLKNKKNGAFGKRSKFLNI
jgi:hypothetical protein